MILPWFKRDFMMWCPSSFSIFSFSLMRSLRYSTLSGSHIVWGRIISGVVSEKFCAHLAPGPSTLQHIPHLLSHLQRPARSVPPPAPPPATIIQLPDKFLTILTPVIEIRNRQEEMTPVQSRSLSIGESDMFINQSTEYKQVNGVYLNFTQISLMRRE